MMKLLNDLSISKSKEEFNSILKEVQRNSNDDFLNYFQRYLKIKEKWVFCFKKANRYDSTNMHIESWHRILKYSYFKTKRNKRVDTLISTLLIMSNDAEYKDIISNSKGIRGTFHKKNSLRHNLSMKKDFAVQGLTIQVL